MDRDGELTVTVEGRVDRTSRKPLYRPSTRGHSNTAVASRPRVVNSISVVVVTTLKDFVAYLTSTGGVCKSTCTKIHVCTISERAS